MTRRAHFLAAPLALVAALSLPTFAASPAAAADPCSPTFETNYDPANPADLSIFVAQTAVDTAAFLDLPGLCFPTTPTLTLTSNPDGAGVTLAWDGTATSGFTVTPPSAFTGRLHVEATIAFGAESRDYSLYVYVATPGASFPSLSPAPGTGSVGVPVVYPLTGLSFPGGVPGSLTVLNPSGQFSASYDPAGPSLTITPLQNIGGAMQARVLIGDGIQAKLYRPILWVGAPIPDHVIWGPQPSPVPIDPRGTGYFTLTNFAPYGSECEIRITTDPEDVTIVAEPPALNGLPSTVGIGVRDDYVGLLTVHYVLGCKEDGGVTSKDFLMLLYVGIPIPTLAETGIDAAPPLAFGATLLAVGLVLTRGRRRLTR